MGSQVVFILNFHVQYYALFYSGSINTNKCKFCGGGAYQLGTGALFGGGGAPITGCGAQIVGGGAGLRPNLTPALI